MKRKLKACPVCGSKTVSVFLDIREAPAHCNILWKNRQDALKVRLCSLRLGYCFGCGHVYNTAFDPEEVKYSQQYENSLHFSQLFQEYARSLAASLIDRHRLYGKDVIEIGCGKGDFLLLMSELGGNRGVGFDASFVEERVETATDSVKFVRDFYSEQYSGYKGDLILSRHVLEHIENPRSFLDKLRAAIGCRIGTPVFFEVPNFMHTIKELAIWDIVYEHCSYFTPFSIKRLFSQGFRIQRVTEEYEGQFLCLDATYVEKKSGRTPVEKSELESMAREVAAFARRYAGKIADWKAELDRIASTGERAVVWGSGSKGVTFLNTFKETSQITHAVDINPHKQGHYIPGTGHEIVSPEALSEIKPDLVIVMNPIYIGEIWETVKQAGLKCRILTA